MPRIEAATVAEHHRMRRTALLEAARDLLAEQGVEAVTVAAVGASAGLARSSVYQYFDSTAALLAAVVEAEVPRAVAEMTAAVQAAGSPGARVRAWLRASLEATTDPAHRSMAELGGPDLPPACRARLAQLHGERLAPLVDALEELDVADAELVAALLEGMVRAAATQVNAGRPLPAVERRLLALLDDGLG